MTKQLGISSYFKYEIKRLQIGVIVILYKNVIIYLLERKTWNDLASTICGKRRDNIKDIVLFKKNPINF